MPASDDEKEDVRQRYVSVAVSFGDLKMLEKHGSGAVDVQCPECGAKGKRYGNPGEDFRFDGFTPLSKGGIAFILCECAACNKRVTLPHKAA